MISIALPQVPLALRPARATVAVGHSLWRVTRRVRRMLVYLCTPRIISPSLHAYLAHVDPCVDLLLACYIATRRLGAARACNRALAITRGFVHDGVLHSPV
ncbi:hypothetical protein C8F04DRAFT_1276842 [Mycena alexandri]|uniref:Uncharacterized protein n=1 Tax=Mycena alexandri TaxID=1745969 RepID=A0AAD6WLS4_9AGAR|nr:hypothetical protein C8F04DRAFT_1276842 [Mycena alexandri]